MSERRPGVGLALVLTGATLFIVNAGVSRVALRAGVDAATLTSIRVTGSLLIFVAFAALFRRSALRPPRGRLAGLVVLHGLVGVALLQWSYFVAIDRLPVGLALLLEYQAPILVAVWARLVQKEAVRNRMWLGLALAMTGLAMATGIGQGLDLDAIGIAAGLVAAVCFAAYFLIGEAGVGQLDPLRVILWSFATATVALNWVAPFWELPDGQLGEQVSLLGKLADQQAAVWAVLAWVVVLGTVVPFTAELFALRHLPATTVTMVAMLEPIGAVVLGWVWFEESLGTVAVLGCTVVVAGILLAQSARRVAPNEPLVT